MRVEDSKFARHLIPGLRWGTGIAVGSSIKELWYNQGRLLSAWISSSAMSPRMPEFIEVDPRELHLPPSRAQGADPFKLARQIAKHGDSLDGMPPLQVVRGQNGHLRINDGVTRATRASS